MRWPLVWLAHGRMLLLTALTLVGALGSTGAASAQNMPFELGGCATTAAYEAVNPGGYVTNGPGAFARDTSIPALTIVGADSWTLSRWMTNTTAVGDGCAGYGMPPLHGGGTITVETLMRTLDVRGSADITLTYWNDQIQFLGSGSSGELKGTNDWTLVTVSDVLPPGTKYVRFEYRLYGPGTLWIGGAPMGSFPRFAWLFYPWPHAVNLTPPTVVGTARVGNLLTTTPGTWFDGLSAGYSYRWYRCDRTGQGCTLIPDAGGYVIPNGPDPPGSYTVRPSDVGFTIRAAVQLVAEEDADFVMTAPTAVVVSADGVQIAPDPGFELDPSPFYSTSGAGSFTWATDAAHGGTHALKISSTTGELGRWLSQTSAIPVTPGSTYDVSAWLKTLGSGAHAYLCVNFWTAGGTYIPATVDAPVLSGTQDWTQETLHVTAPAGAASVRVEIRLNGPGSLWADDLTVSS